MAVNKPKKKPKLTPAMLVQKEKVVAALKREGKTDNPWALANWIVQNRPPTGRK